MIAFEGFGGKEWRQSRQWPSFLFSLERESILMCHSPASSKSRGVNVMMSTLAAHDGCLAELSSRNEFSGLCQTVEVMTWAPRPQTKLMLPRWGQSQQGRNSCSREGNSWKEMGLVKGSNWRPCRTYALCQQGSGQRWWWSLAVYPLHRVHFEIARSVRGSEAKDCNKAGLPFHESILFSHFESRGTQGTLEVAAKGCEHRPREGLTENKQEGEDCWRLISAICDGLREWLLL